MLIYFITLSTLSLSLCYATPTTPCQKLHQSQLTSLNERMNQMIEALYSSSILAKPKSSTATTENSAESITGNDYAPSTVAYESPYYSPTYSIPVPAPPQIVYVAPSPPPGLAFAPSMPPYPPMSLPSPSIPSTYYPPLESSALPPEYSYPATPYRYPSIPSYDYSYSTPPQVPPAQYSPPPVPYSSQYQYPTPIRYEYKYSYPEHPAPPVPSYPSRPYLTVPPQQHYASIPEYPPPSTHHAHSPYARYSELIPAPQYV